MKKKRSMHVLLILLLVAIVAAGLIIYRDFKNDPYKALSEETYKRSMEAVQAYIDSYSSETNYYSVRGAWEAEGVAIPGGSYTIISDAISGGEVVAAADSVSYNSDVLSLKPGNDFSFNVDVKEAGLYELWMDYYVTEETYIAPKLEVLVNGKAQYNEMMNIELPIDWQVMELKEGSKWDRYGDELTPKSEIALGWQTTGLSDPNYFFKDPLKLKLEQGVNKVHISIKEGYVLLGNITIQNTNSDVPNYDTYRKGINEEQRDFSQLITIEAEDMAFKNRISIRPKYVRDPQVTPYAYKNRVLNVLDGFSFGDSGNEVTYSFAVEEDGFYQIAFKYYQNTNNGLPTHRRVEIDGEVPFKELEHYVLAYSSDWKNEVLHDKNNQPFEIYLEKGEHTLTLAIDNFKIRDVYHELLITLKVIDSIAQDINKLTGGLVDKERKWKIEKYLPNVAMQLQGLANRVDEQKKKLIVYLGSDELPTVNELEITREMLQRFADDPEKLPHYMKQFNEGVTSAYGRINTILPMLVYNPLHLDKIFVYSNEKLPKPKAFIGKSLFEGTKAFFYTFFDPKYNKAAKVDNKTIKVWVNNSRLYVEIMQRMIDDQFTPQTGIKVNLSILPDENKIILSNAANNTPDAAVGISSARPFELALRGVIEDMRGYDGFYDLAKEFNPNTFISYIYGTGVYAIPETQNVKLLYYRKDILDFLDVETPQTWEDVIGLIPLLQKYDMNFFSPLGTDNAYKGFDVTTPFFYQFGGKLYNETGDRTVINKAGGYEAFEFMVDLFSVYNVPITTANFFQHFRSGKIPVGISDTNTYIQLKYAAPELSGQWGIQPIIGNKNEQGVIERWDPTFGSSSIMFKDSKKKDMVWEFIKWWSSADAQSGFSYEVQSILGDKFLYMTANIDGFKKSAWPSDSKDIILEQWKWIQATGKVPGDYMLEREISNAWNQAVFEGISPRIAIDKAVAIIDRELERKLKEFGYIVDGELDKPYIVPTKENVEMWVKENEK